MLGQIRRFNRIKRDSEPKESAISVLAEIATDCMTRLLSLLLAFGFALSTAGAQPTIFIVRHAEKADTAGENPELSEVGRTRAEALANLLKDANITAIYTTEFKRTQETAAPLAKATGITPVSVPAKDTATLAAKLRDAKGNILVVGHGNTIPDLLKALGISASVNIGDSDYNELFLVVLDGTARLIHLHYH
jgi:phosphohistidine phosphatase SixA